VFFGSLIPRPHLLHSKRSGPAFWTRAAFVPRHFGHFGVFESLIDMLQSSHRK